MVNSTEIVTEPNLAFLDAELRILRLRLEALGKQNPAGSEKNTHQGRSEEIKDFENFLSTLRAESIAQGWRLHPPRIRAAFQLSQFEYRLLILAAAAELDEGFGELIANTQESGTLWPSVGLAWRLFCPTNQDVILSRNSLREDAPLIRFRLLQMVGGESPLPARHLRVDRRIADALLGHMMPDARLAPIVRLHQPSDVRGDVSPTHLAFSENLAQYIGGYLRNGSTRSQPLVIELHSAPETDLELLAAATAGQLGLPLLAASAKTLPISLGVEFARESLLLPCLVFLGGIDFAGSDGAAWIRTLTDSAPVICLGSERSHRRPMELNDASWLSVALPALSVPERTELWAKSLAGQVEARPEELGELAETFDLGVVEIRETSRAVMRMAELRGEKARVEDVVSACRREAQHRMEELAQRLNPLSSWDDLLLPADTAAKLHELCAQVRCQHRVLEGYGFSGHLTRGLGVTALFSGPSGTGKTLAAEVIAHDLNRELFRVDLARVVSKYIGETEKNLRQVFLEAERARCVVLFDEADALFGRRTEVRDSHDRYANIEVSYLLQLLEETESAVVLLATNRREAIDEAFMRRFRFLVDFPIPDAQMRRQLWATAFPTQVPLADVAFDVLAERLPLSGASIRNIALAAAFLAASDGGVVGPAQIARSAQRELEKLGRPAPFSDAELRVQDNSKGSMA